MFSEWEIMAIYMILYKWGNVIALQPLRGWVLGGKNKTKTKYGISILLDLTKIQKIVQAFEVQEFHTRTKKKRRKKINL